MKALVLSGGSIKGAFQAGAVAEVLARGFVPDLITTISVGALNGSFIINETGKAVRAGAPVNWPGAGIALVNFWRQKITSPSSLITKKPGASVAWSVLFNNFNGLVDTTPLKNLVTGTLDLDDMRASPARFCAGSVNLASGQLIYADLSFPDLEEYVIASAALPVVMPISSIANQPLIDGGVRDIAPLKISIDQGADEIVCIVCQAADVPATTVNLKSVIALLTRIMDVTSNEIVQNDIEWATYINEWCPEDGSRATEGPFRGYRRVKLTVIRPKFELAVDIETFNAADISKMLDLGKFAAQEALK